MFGSKGSAQGQLNEPCDVAVDGDSNVLVVDRDNHCIQKFTGAGEFVTAVGQNGRKHLEFSFPSGIAINHMNRKVYICDQNNHRIHILNADLTFFKSFGSYGNGDGQFNWPWDATFDSTGNVYVADWGRDCIQVFTAEGNFLRKFEKKGRGDGELNSPHVSIDLDDLVYVADLKTIVFPCSPVKVSS